jgi:hypothetical protein
MGSIYENSKLAELLINNDTIGGEFSSYKLVKGAKLNSNTNSRTYYPPEFVTADAIKNAKSDNSDRVIIHYMQPHAPYLAEAIKRKKFEFHEESPFKYLKEGGDRSLVWNSYINNLRFVLKNVDILLNTSDHGELFGEWGLYSHIYGIPHPSLRKVPWVETTAEKNLSFDPDILFSTHKAVDEESDIQDRLSALGYLS